MGKEYYFRDPRTHEELTGIFWDSAKQFQKFLSELKLENQDCQDIQPDNYGEDVKEVFPIFLLNIIWNGGHLTAQNARVHNSQSIFLSLKHSLILLKIRRPFVLEFMDASYESNNCHGSR